jgi:MFS family permease
MYRIESIGRLLKLAARGPSRPKVARNVVILGTTSLLMDVSTEMVTVVLPLYVVFALGASPFLFGIVDALNQGASALVRVAAGFFSDRSGRHKSVAVAGYGLSAVSRLGLIAAGGAAAGLSFAVLVDRIGKGIRTGPRDALISLSTRPEALGVAFGVHRAMDTAGAMLGPLVAFGLLALVPGAYDAVFVVSLCFGVLAVGVIVLFAENRTRGADGGDEVAATVAPVTLRDAARLVAVPRFRRLLVVGSLLALVTISDAFIYLAMQRRVDFDPVLVPLLFVGSAAAYMVLAVPVGRIADRVGRIRVFLAGHVLLVGLYVGLLLTTGLGAAFVVAGLVLLGAYYAATDGVLMAYASTLLPEHLRASGLSLVVTATSLARLVASLAFGAIWAAAGLTTALQAYLAALAVALAAAAFVLASGRRTAHA